MPKVFSGRLSGDYDRVSDDMKETQDKMEEEWEKDERHSGEFDIGCHSGENKYISFVNKVEFVKNEQHNVNEVLYSQPVENVILPPFTVCQT